MSSAAQHIRCMPRAYVLETPPRNDDTIYVISALLLEGIVTTTRGRARRPKGKPGVQAYPTGCATRATVVPSSPRRCVGAARERVQTFEPTATPAYRLDMHVRVYCDAGMYAHAYCSWYVCTEVGARMPHMRAWDVRPEVKISRDGNL